MKNRILNDLKHQWTVEEMADYVELSAPHLQKLFKAQVGMPPIAYLRELLLEKACKQLETTFAKIQQIRASVGRFNDSHFTRDFKTKYGVTPTEYRKCCWKKMQIEEPDGQKR